ncbi:MAG: DUF3352 domain-containing protein [Bacteroidia bacterium]
MKRKVIIVSAVIVTLVLIGAGWWFFFRNNTKPSDAINAVPHDAAVILEIRDFSKAWATYKTTATYREELEQYETFQLFRDNVDFVDSILKNNTVAAEIFANRKMYISVHTNPEFGMEYLYCMSLEKANMKEKLDEVVKAVNTENAIYRNFEYGNTIVTSVKKTETDSAFYYTQYQGVFIASYSLLLTESAIDQLNNGGSMMKDDYFVKAVESSGKNVEVNIYINYKRFPSYVQLFLKAENSSALEALSKLAEWSELDVNQRPEGLMLNGFTYPNDTAAHYLNLFTVQKPQEVEFPAVLPANTATFMFFGINDILSFYSDYKTHLKRIKDIDRYELEVKNINTTYDIDIELSLFSWMGNQFGMCITEPKATAFSENTYAVFKARRGELANDLLSGLVKSLSEKQGEAEQEVYQEYTITNINLPRVLPRLFGSAFEQMETTYYTILGDYVIFGNTMQSVKNYINYYIADKTLGKDVYFSSYSENLSSTFNVFIYSSPSRSKNIVDSYVNRETSKELDNSEETLRKFEGLAVQMSSNGSAFYTNVYLKYNADYSGTKANVFEARLDTTVSGKPVFLKNSFSGENEIFVQDDANNVYLISSMGTILWKKQIPEKINGKVHQVDVYKNGKLQILFGTTNFIYLVDRKGEDVTNYPIELEAPATSPLSVFDYDGKRDYRLFVACKNKKVYCMDAKGEVVKGWGFKKTNETVSQPIVHVRTGGKDYIVIAENDGKLNILDRKGSDKTKVKEKFRFGHNTLQVFDGLVAFSDSTGKVYTVSMNGKTEKIAPKEFTAHHHFVYGDINSDKTPELIFSDLNEVFVYNAKGETLFGHKFQSEATLPPLICETWDGNRLGAVCNGSSEVFIFTAGGEVEEDFPLAGSTLFDVAVGNGDIPSLLVTASGSAVMIYPLE